MTPKALLEEILRLPPDERLRLVEDVWDSLAAAPSDLPVPDWHRAELDRRMSDASEQASLSWSDVEARLRPPSR